MAWAPKYGLKGMIDASLRIKIESNAKEVIEKIMPLEFKTGKATNGQASLSSFLKFCVNHLIKMNPDLLIVGKFQEYIVLVTHTFYLFSQPWNTLHR